MITHLVINNYEPNAIAEMLIKLASLKRTTIDRRTPLRFIIEHETRREFKKMMSELSPVQPTLRLSYQVMQRQKVAQYKDFLNYLETFH